MIPIDQHSVDEVLAGFQAWARKQAEFMEKTGRSSTKYTGKKRPPPELAKLIREGERGRYYDRITLTTPWGSKRVVNIHIMPGHTAVCCAGDFRLLSRKSRSYVVSVYFPETMPPERLAEDRTALRLRSALLHELTHAVDKIGTIEEKIAGFLSGVRGVSTKKAKKVAIEIGEKFGEALVRDPEQIARATGASRGKIEKARRKWLEMHGSVSSYYNQPHEIRAFLRMLYEEVRPVVRALEKRRPDAGLAGHIEAALLFSEIWNWDINVASAQRDVRFPATIREKFMLTTREKPKPYHEYLTAKNRNYMLKKLYQALSKGEV